MIENVRKNMNEDDTYRRIMRPTFEEIAVLFHEWSDRGRKITTAKENEIFLNSHSWTTEQYIERFKRKYDRR